MRVSVILPTWERRDLVTEVVRAFARQENAPPFEVIVVVDGSQDGTGAALRGLHAPFPLTVHEQPNRGAASARNRGAAAARGEVLLFLDDDMEADPRLLAEHDRAHRQGADVVVGHLPLDPRSPANMLSATVRRWAENRFRKLSAPGATLTAHDLLSGHISIRAELFRRLGGFDEGFTRGGAYGNEDLDLGYRVLASGCRAVFHPAAVSYHRYVVKPRQHLRQWRQTGRADVIFARKHPDHAAALFALRGAGTPRFQRLWRPMLTVPGLARLFAAVLKPVAIALASRENPDGAAFRIFRAARDLEYWRGVREAGGIPKSRPFPVLAWHAIADLAGDGVLGAYGVPPERFRSQLAWLRRAGWRFVAPNEVLRFLEGGGGLPRRSLLLTFDDGYVDFAREAIPALGEHSAPAVVFAVSQRLGRSNEWDQGIGARKLSLLDGPALQALAARGIEIGAHSRTHPILPRLADGEIADEVAGSREDLAAAGLGSPRFFAYPSGVTDERVCRIVREAGFAAAFTVDAGWVRPGADRFRLPRIEVFRNDAGWRLLLKLTWAWTRRAGRARLARPVG